MIDSYIWPEFEQNEVAIKNRQTEQDTPISFINNDHPPINKQLNASETIEQPFSRNLLQKNEPILPRR